MSGPYKLDLRDVSRQRGVFIVFDGIDGAGKSALVAATAACARAAGLEVVSTVSPPREALQRPLYLRYMLEPAARESIDYRGLIAVLMGERLQHAHELIGPSLTRGAAVLCDRYVFSAAAHFLARGFPDESWFVRLAAHLPRPTLAFHASAPLQVTRERVRTRSGHAESYLEEDFHARLHAAYETVCRSNGLIHVDTVTPVEETFSALRARIETALSSSARGTP